MDDDLLFRNKFVSDLKVPSTYDIKNKNKEAAFRQYIDKKKNIVGLNDEDTDIFEENVMTTNPIVLKEDGKLNKDRHVVERRYIYSINSKSRQMVKEQYIEKEIITGEYVKVSITSVGELIYEPIDVDELNNDYNALNITNAVVNPFVLSGDNLYFKTFLYRTPDYYISDLPLMHTNVKSIRLLNTIIPCTLTNVNKYNNHVMIDILFGSAQIPENLDYNVVFGTLIIKIPYGNYTIDQVCSYIKNQVNTFYWNGYKNNTNDSDYDKANMLSENFFSYNYDTISGELYFSIEQPSGANTISKHTITTPSNYENYLSYSSDSKSDTVQFPVISYTNFLDYARTIAAAMSYNFNDYIVNDNTYVEQFTIFEYDNNVYLSSLENSFSVTLVDNVKDSLGITAAGTPINSSQASFYAVDVTAGQKAFTPYDLTGISSTASIVFTTTNTTGEQVQSIANQYYTSFNTFVTKVLEAMNVIGSNTFYLHTSTQKKFNPISQVYEDETRYYIMSNSVEFTFKPGTTDEIQERLFGSTQSGDIGSIVNVIQIQEPTANWPYIPTATIEIHFRFDNEDFIAYIQAINYNTYDAFIDAVVDAMNNTCKSGFFAFDRELENGEYKYYLYSGGDFTLNFSSMHAIGTIMTHPPSSSDITSLEQRIDLTAGYNAFVYPYNAYVSDYSKFYVNLRQISPNPPFEDDPASTNTLLQLSLDDDIYTSIQALMDKIIEKLNTATTVATATGSWIKTPTGTTEPEPIQFDYDIVEDKIVIKHSNPDVYEFNIDGSLMVAFASFLGISTEFPTTYVTTYTAPHKYGNRLRFKMAFENNPDVPEDDQLWYMLGFRANNSLNYYDTPWTNMFNFGTDEYYFSNTSFLNSFVTNRETEVVPNTENLKPYRLPSMTKSNYIYMKLNNYENLYDTSIPNEKIFTKILLTEDYGKFAYDTFVDNPYVLATTDSRLDRLEISFIDKNANPVDFNDIDHSFTLEIVEYNDRLSVNDYNTRRGYNEHSSYPDALSLSH